jgi:hypothetical protein
MSPMVATLGEPIYILKDHIAPEPVNLRAKHHGKGGFTFTTSSTGGAPSEVISTANSKIGSSAPRRLIRDATGNGILELWRNAVGDESYISRPTGASLPLAIVAPRVTAVKDKVDVYVKSSTQGNEETKLEVRGQDIWKRNTLVYHGNDLVMRMKIVNYVTSFVPFSGNRWDVVVAQGFDLSLMSFYQVTAGCLIFSIVIILTFAQACAIIVYLGTTVYDNSKFRSSYGLGDTDNRGAGGDSRRWQLGRVPLTVVGDVSATLAAGAGSG